MDNVVQFTPQGAKTFTGEQLWTLGYRELISVAHRHVPIRAAGKRPAFLKNGRWETVGAVRIEATQDLVRQWGKDGASIGIRCDKGLVAIDIDTRNPEFSAKIAKGVLKRLGAAPVRYGRRPKQLLLFRLTEPMPYRQVKFDDGTEKGGLVEVLTGDARWFVAAGEHPTTEQPYEWPEGLPHRDDLTEVTPEQITALVEELKEGLPKAKANNASSVDREAVPQDQLRAPDLEIVKSAMQVIIDTGGADDGYDPWYHLSVALRGACYDDPDLGCDLFIEATAQYTGQQTEDAQRVYWSSHPPFAFGWGFIRDLAKKRGWAPTHLLDNDIPEPPDPVDDPEKAEDVFPLETVKDLYDKPEPEWLIDRYLLRQSAGFVYSVPGAGKSFLMLDMALHVASKEPAWHGDEIITNEQPRVLYLAAEGSYAFGNRVKAWVKQHPLAGDLTKSFFVLPHAVNFTKGDQVAKLIRTLKQKGRFDLTIVDTVSRVIPGADENTQKEMTLFVEACRVIQERVGGCVIGVHHANKSGEEMRGSSVLQGAGDFVFKLTRKKGATIGEMYCEKMKDAPDDWSDHYAFDVVNMGENTKGKPVTSLVPSRIDIGGSDVEVTPDLTGQILDAMREAGRSGEPWAKAAQAGERRAIRRMVADFGLRADTAENMLKIWEQTGVVTYGLVNSSSKRKGYSVVVDAGQPVLSEDVFG